jgi:hypothetical protein
MRLQHWSNLIGLDSFFQKPPNDEPIQSRDAYEDTASKPGFEIICQFPDQVVEPELFASSLLENNVYTWTSEMSTSGHRQKWTFVKQISMVLAHVPRQRPRMDIAQGPRVDILQTSSLHGPKKKPKPLFEKKAVALEGFEIQSTAWRSSA